VTLGEFTACAPVFLVLALMQLLGALYGPAAGVLMAVGVGAAASLAPRYARLGYEQWWLLTLLAAAASACGVALPMFVTDRPQWGMLLFPAVAGSLACIIALARSGGAVRCGSCHRAMKGGSFECPRCGTTVCDRSCWNFQSSRCRACEENHVPIFTADPAWWERNLGRRIPKGRCQLCLTAAGEADLRDCQQCGRSYCRSCWDASNGQCGHCLWSVRELPARLQRYVLQYDSPTRSTRRTQRVPRSSD
jgi:hypothetical protein